jgi:elongation factor 2
MAGMGELHLEIVAIRIQRDRGVELKTSPPIVVYRESIAGRAGPVEGKSPNHHNRFYIEFEPLEAGVITSLKDGKISMKGEEIERRKILIENGMDKDEARSIVGFYGTNVLLNMTKGIQYLRETMELILES